MSPNIKATEPKMKVNGVRTCTAVITMLNKSTKIMKLNLEYNLPFGLDEMAMWLKEKDPGIDTIRFTASK